MFSKSSPSLAHLLIFYFLICCIVIIRQIKAVVSVYVQSNHMTLPTVMVAVCGIVFSVLYS